MSVLLPESGFWQKGIRHLMKGTLAFKCLHHGNLVGLWGTTGLESRFLTDILDSSSDKVMQIKGGGVLLCDLDECVHQGILVLVAYVICYTIVQLIALPCHGDCFDIVMIVTMRKRCSVWILPLWCGPPCSISWPCLIFGITRDVALFRDDLWF